MLVGYGQPKVSYLYVARRIEKDVSRLQVSMNHPLKQTDKQTDGWTDTDRHMDRENRQTHRETDRWTDRQIDRQTDRWTDGQMDMNGDRRIDRENRWTDRDSRMGRQTDRQREERRGIISGDKPLSVCVPDPPPLP